jgi:hypothetical protein
MRVRPDWTDAPRRPSPYQTPANPVNPKGRGVWAKNQLGRVVTLNST